MANFLRVEVTGMKGVFRYLKRVSAKSEKEGFKLTGRIADIIVGKARSIVAPFKTGTGALRNSIRSVEMLKGHRVIAGDSRTVNRFGVNYAPFQEYGFKAHRTKIWNLNTSSVLYKKLKEKGKKGSGSIMVKNWTPFLSPAYRFALNRMNMEMNKTASRIVQD